MRLFSGVFAFEASVYRGSALALTQAPTQALALALTLALTLAQSPAPVLHLLVQEWL